MNYQLHPNKPRQMAQLALNRTILNYDTIQHILSYLPPPLTNKTIHEAIEMWYTNKEESIRTYGDISEWNTTYVTNMDNLFIHCFYMNENISDWDTSNVTTMVKMFYGAPNFNQQLNWDTSRVTNMAFMFWGAKSFNQPLNWDTSNVTNMTGMFLGAISFNQPLNWNTENVQYMMSMFSGTHQFNQPLNHWNTKNVINMRSMFAYARKFNQCINSWNTSKLTDISYMFWNASDFNQTVVWDLSQLREGGYNNYVFYKTGIDATLTNKHTNQTTVSFKFEPIC